MINIIQYIINIFITFDQFNKKKNLTDYKSFEQQN